MYRSKVTLKWNRRREKFLSEVQEVSKKGDAQRTSIADGGGIEKPPPGN